MATKTATVQSGQTAGTNTNFPAYVDLADVGVTTLAEAQSIRVYSDAGLTTELAREIVSVTEMHVKIPSMTSSTQIWIDYDSVRADYAVGATYGRNAVWADYAGVYHFESDATDSSGNQATGTVTGATNTAVEIGNGYDFDGVNDVINLGRISQIESQTEMTISMWHRPDSISSLQQIFGKPDIGSGEMIQFYWENSTTAKFSFNAAGTGINVINPTTQGILTGVNQLFHITFNGAGASGDRYNFYVDASAKSFTHFNDTDTGNRTNDFRMGARTSLTGDLNGAIDELRLTVNERSANWITTEYNNQNDNAAFWGTWTDAGGGGPTANNSARRMLLMQM